MSDSSTIRRLHRAAWWRRRRRACPSGAWDGDGRDVLDVLSRRDHKFASGFTPSPYDGFANLHALTLDLGDVKPNAPLRLLDDGLRELLQRDVALCRVAGGREADLAVCRGAIAGRQLEDASPAKRDFRPGWSARLSWTCPASCPAGTKRIRLQTNLEIYWDQVLIDQSEDAESRTSEVPLAQATLHFRGYPKQIEGASPGDLDYDYDRVSLTGPFQRQRGNYTRTGDVTSLVNSIDDRFAIFGSGEEIAVEFDATKLPALPPHWKRDYFFYANGFVKDMDWWDGSPFTVAQLPFHGM